MATTDDEASATDLPETTVPPPDDAGQSSAPQECRLLQLPDHLILEVGLCLDSITDLHTLLRRTCRRLHALTTPPRHASNMEAAAAATSASVATAEEVSSPSSAAAAAAPDPASGGDRPSCQEASGGSGSTAQQAASGGAAVPPDQAIKARWLMRWEQPGVGKAGCAAPLCGPAWAGDADLTLYVMDLLGPSPHRVCIALYMALTNAQRDHRHERVIERLIERHGDQMEGLSPEAQSKILMESAGCGSVALFSKVLDLGGGGLLTSAELQEKFESSWGLQFDPPPRWDRMPISAADIVLSSTTCTDYCKGAGGRLVALLLAAEEAGRATVAPLTVVLWIVAVARQEGWRRQPSLVEGMELLTRPRCLGERVRALADCIHLGDVLDILTDAAADVAATGDVSTLARLLEVLPPMPFHARTHLVVGASANGHCGALELLLGPQPRPADTPAYLEGIEFEQEDGCDALIRSLAAAAEHGHTEAAVVLLDAKCSPEGEAIVTTHGNVYGPFGALRCSGALVAAAREGHGGTVRALVERARATDGGAPAPRGLLVQAAQAADTAGQRAVADELWGMVAAAPGRRRGARS